MTSGSSVDSSLAYPNSSLKISAATPSSKAKSKLNRFKITTSILKQSSSSASPRPPEVFNGLPNGLLSLVSAESCSKTSIQWRNYKDSSDFGSFQKCSLGSKDGASGAGEASREMYSLSEEAGESEKEENEGAPAGSETQKEHAGMTKREDSLDISCSFGEDGNKAAVEEDTHPSCTEPVPDEQARL